MTSLVLGTHSWNPGHGKQNQGLVGHSRMDARYLVDKKTAKKVLFAEGYFN